jgi:hypothetical protein
MKAKEHIENIRQQIEESKKRRFGKDMETSLGIIPQIFAKETRFLMEFIQNSEDACKNKNDGKMEIWLSKEKITIINNGKPFDESDVDSICGIRSYKKIEEGTLGYLGIGFKSVFKVAKRVDIISGDYKFKFDKIEYKNHYGKEENFWIITPFWLEKIEEEINPNKTNFIIYLDEKEKYEIVEQEIKELTPCILMFLRNLKEIKIINKVSNKRITLKCISRKTKNEEIEEIEVAENDISEKYLVFRRVVKVPTEIKESDEIKKFKREKITQREVVLGFRIENGDLVPLSKDKVISGVYSFLPISEAKSGAKYLIHADFISTPGREQLNTSSKWNKWLVKEILELLKSKFEYLKQNFEKEYKYLHILEYEPEGEDLTYKFFEEHLHKPLWNYINEHEETKNWVAVNEDLWELIEPEDLKIIYKIEKPVKKKEKWLEGISECGNVKIPHLNIEKIIKDKEFLESKKKDIEWFKKLYCKLADKKIFNEETFVLTNENELKLAKEIYWLEDFPSEVEELYKKYPHIKNKILKNKPTINHELLKEPKIKEFFKEQKNIIKSVKFEDIVKEEILPYLQTSYKNPSEKDIMGYTHLVYKAYKEAKAYNRDSSINIGEIWILTKDGKIVSSRENIFFSEEYSPDENWEKNKKYIPEIKFLSPKYIENMREENLKEIKEFFKKIGIKEKCDDDSLISVFGENYFDEHFEDLRLEIIEIKKSEIGKDRVAKTKDGREIYIEIKSCKEKKNIELTDTQTQRAKKERENYIVVIISGIPENPVLYRVVNPYYNKGSVVEKLKLPPAIWEKMECLHKNR